MEEFSSCVSQADKEVLESRVLALKNSIILKRVQYQKDENSLHTGSSNLESRLDRAVEKLAEIEEKLQRVNEEDTDAMKVIAASLFIRSS